MEVSSKPKSNSNMDNDYYSNDSFADNENSTSEKRFRKLSTVSVNQQSVNKDSRLSECLNYLHSMIGRKDKEDIFQYPVTGNLYNLIFFLTFNLEIKNRFNCSWL